MGTKQDRVTVRFDGETMAQLEELAEAKNMPVAGVVRAACDLYLGSLQETDRKVR